MAAAARTMKKTVRDKANSKGMENEKRRAVALAV
jgi:hypothetical protein